ncbi:MAG: penicillin-binding protein 2, partial [Firmicutes bacterium]|nr:penicillin-binding protein 2 [Bacillota bacterium]
IATSNIDSDYLEKIAQNNLPGIVFAERHNRYAEGVWGSHLLGHLSPMDQDGKVGLEYVFNDELSPERPNVLAAVVDGKGRLISGIGYRYRKDKSSYGPYNIVLTIDLEMQKIVERVMDQRILQGAVVVIDPYQGDILAMASRPNYNPEQVSTYLNHQEEYQDFLVLKPLLNRALLSYPPGSIFKLVVAAAALETNAVSLFDTFSCPGYFELGNDIFRCSNPNGHGEITFAEGFAYSCNTVFIKVAMQMGRETIYHYAKLLGLGQKTGVPLGSKQEGGEAEGFVPSPQEMPFLGDLALTAIGQGKVEMTPLQVARLTGIIAGGGKELHPRLVQAITTRQGYEVRKFNSPRKRSQILSPSVVQQLKYMMLGVTSYGTGQDAFLEDFIAGGKTGTAETGRIVNGSEETYSWFTGIVPLDSPGVVITVFIEKPIQGSAASVFQEISQGVIEILKKR